MVQTNQAWWDSAKRLQYVHSQEEFNHYRDDLTKVHHAPRCFDMWSSNRRVLFWARFYMYGFFFKMHFRFPTNFKWLIPGLEVKYALEEA